MLGNFDLSHVSGFEKQFLQRSLNPLLALRSQQCLSWFKEALVTLNEAFSAIFGPQCTSVSPFQHLSITFQYFLIGP